MTITAIIVALFIAAESAYRFLLWRQGQHFDSLRRGCFGPCRCGCQNCAKGHHGDCWGEQV